MHTYKHRRTAAPSGLGASGNIIEDLDEGEPFGAQCISQHIPGGTGVQEGRTD